MFEYIPVYVLSTGHYMITLHLKQHSLNINFFENLILEILLQDIPTIVPTILSQIPRNISPHKVLHTIPILLYFTHMLGFMTQKESMNMLLASLDYKRHSKTLFIACKINQNKQINKGNPYSLCYVHQLI